MADLKISELPAASALDGTELLVLSQSGTSVKTTAGGLLTEYAGGWVRPSDWLPMPTSVAQYTDLLVAVYPTGGNYIALSFTVVGGYTVDWGDGDVTNHASAATAEHQYDFSDPALDGTTTSLGYKQAIIRVYPQAANPVTVVNLGIKHTAASLNTLSLIIDSQFNVPSATAFTLRSATITQRLLQRINFIAMGAVTNWTNQFLDHTALEQITFPSGSLASVTNLSGAFSGCFQLKSITFPSGSLASVTTLATAFQNCYRLQSVSFPSGSLVSNTTLASTFSGCASLRSVSFPSGSLASVTTIAGVFTSCSKLETVTFPAGSLVVTTTIASAFQSCASLQSIAFPASSLTLVVTTTNAFFGCTNLNTITNCSIPVSFSVLDCRLSGTDLDAVYTALPSVAATITVTGNYGVATDTPGIATGKGWTVTG